MGEPLKGNYGTTTRFGEGLETRHELTAPRETTKSIRLVRQDWVENPALLWNQ